MTNREVENLGIPRSSFAMAQRFQRLPEEAYEVACGMSSYLLGQDLAQIYLTSRPHRLETARIFKELGVRGKELGQVMRDLHTLAAENAQPRRRQIHRRSI